MGALSPFWCYMWMTSSSIGNDVGMLSIVKAWLSRHFSMKDLGEASYILGIRIYRDRSKRMLGLSQSRYIKTIVKMFDIENSKKGRTWI